MSDAWSIERIESPGTGRMVFLALAGHWRIRRSMRMIDYIYATNFRGEGDDSVLEVILTTVARADRLELRDPLFAAHTATCGMEP